MESHTDSSDAAPRAFLRWAGGKSWLVRKVNDIFGSLKFGTYHEPFLGGGSFFFAVASGRNALLSDKNDALVEAFNCIKDDCEGVIAHMRVLTNSKEEYYRIRECNPASPQERTAQFIYLNQTSFNGIYRVNLNGTYNVPYGFRSKAFLDETSLRAASKALQSATIETADFGSRLENIKKGDLVFLDPPYTVSHNNNGFIKYNKSLFSLSDQHRLSAFIKNIKEIGAQYILTNAAHDTIKNIFELGDHRIEASRASLVGGKLAKRGSVSEYIFTNIDVEDEWPR